MNIETANRLYQFRKKSNLSQEELAQKIGVSRQAVSKWERAEASPDTDNLILLAQIYGVSLDELIKGMSEDYNAESDKTNDGSTQSTKQDSSEDAEPGVSFKNGIHVNDANGRVDISLKGIHVDTNDGTKVSIDKNGVFVNENGKQRVYTTENGNIIGDKEVIRDSTGKNFWKQFPVTMLIIIAFLVLGVLGFWHPAWMLFLLIPVYYTTVEAIQKKNANIFCYPVVVVIAYLALGFSPLCLWHPGWILFLTIPLYYGIVNLFKN